MKYVICNWKMNPTTFVDAKALFNATKKLATKYPKAETVLIPPTIFLRELKKGYKGTSIEFGVQNIFWEQDGSHTGETSPAQVHDAGATYALIGHAERRALGEDNEQVRRKVAACVHDKLSPIIAVGERERDDHAHYVREVQEQILTALTDVPVAKLKDVTIAYEPVWAIGAESAPDAHAVHQMVLLVKKTLADAYGEKAMKSVKVVYGGSVNNENAADIFAVPDLSGVLLGRASLDPAKLEAVMKAAAEA